METEHSGSSPPSSFGFDLCPQGLQPPHLLLSSIYSAVPSAPGTKEIIKAGAPSPGRPGRPQPMSSSSDQAEWKQSGIAGSLVPGSRQRGRGAKPDHSCFPLLPTEVPLSAAAELVPCASRASACLNVGKKSLFFSSLCGSSNRWVGPRAQTLSWAHFFCFNFVF